MSDDASSVTVTIAWLFADVALILALIGLGSTRPETAEVESPPVVEQGTTSTGTTETTGVEESTTSTGTTETAPTTAPIVPGIDPDPLLITLQTSESALASSAERSRVVGTILDALRSAQAVGRRAGLVFTSGYSRTSIAAGNGLASAVNRLVAVSFPAEFGIPDTGSAPVIYKTIRVDAAPEGRVVMEIYFFND